MNKKYEQYLRLIEKNPHLVEATTPKMTKYIPHAPYPKQAAFMMLPHREALYGGAAGGGKAMALDTVVPTTNGDKTIGSLEVGDMVFGIDGKPCRILAKSDVYENHECFKIRFDSGAVVVVDGDHRWYTKTKKEKTSNRQTSEEYRKSRKSTQVRFSKWGGKQKRTKIKESPPQKPEGSVKTTFSIAETVETNIGEKNHTIPTCDPLAYEEKILPIHPYIVGAWLSGWSPGEGCNRNHIDDNFILKKIRKYFGRVTKRDYKTGKFDKNFSLKLESVGIPKEKHIPESYMTASIGQRTDLLHGIMDMGGTCEKDGGAQAFIDNNDLAESVATLARGLGFKVFLNRYKTSAKLSTNKIKITSNRKLFSIPRKAERQKNGNRQTQRHHQIVECEKVDTVPVQCVKVDREDGLFLCTKHFVPTHNSDAILMSALQYVDQPEYSALIIRRSYADLSMPNAIMDRAKKWLSPWSSEITWSEEKKLFRFPSGSTLKFGYLTGVRDLDQYQGAEFHFCGFDELTQFEEECYKYLFSRLRRGTDYPFPTRMRSATNPGGIGGRWVKERFVETKTSERCFIQATVYDNPALNAKEYIENLSELDEATKKQLLEGDWDVQKSGVVYPTLAKRFPEGCVTKRFDRFKGETFGGIDWGHSSPCCFLCATIDADNIIWVWFERYIRGKTLQENMDEIPDDPEITWFADPSQPELIAQMRQRDFTVRKATNGRDYGIDVVKSLILKKKLRISESCQALIEESERYRYRDDRDVSPTKVSDPKNVNETPYKIHDHAMDALRYLCVGITKKYGIDIKTKTDFAEENRDKKNHDEKNKEFFSEKKEVENVTEEEKLEWFRIDNPAFW